MLCFQIERIKNVRINFIEQEYTNEKFFNKKKETYFDFYKQTYINFYTLDLYFFLINVYIKNLL